MGRPKIARKSTHVDMTAFCDVAFLLLSFFILATKTKPPEAIQVTTPSSVSSKAAEDVNQVMVVLSNEGKVFMSFSEEERRQQVVEEVAKIKGVSISQADIQKAGKVEFFGAPIAALSQFINLDPEKMKGNLLPGIPATDSANNEVRDWMLAVANIYRGDKMNLYVKGDNAAKYPAFKQVIDAFKATEQLKFSVITGQESIPETSELAKSQRATKSAE